MWIWSSQNYMLKKKSADSSFRPSTSIAKKGETLATAGVPQESFEFWLLDYFYAQQCGIGALGEYATTNAMQCT